MIEIKDQIKVELRDAAKWARILAIIGFIAVGILVLFAFLFSVIFRSMTEFQGGDSGMGIPDMGNTFSGLFTFFYLVLAAIYFFPVYFLYQFSDKTLAALRSDDEISFEKAMRQLRRHYQLLGIITLIIVGFYVLVFGASILFGVAAGGAFT
jgi:amino acid transporter